MATFPQGALQHTALNLDKGKTTPTLQKKSLIGKKNNNNNNNRVTQAMHPVKL